MITILKGDIKQVKEEMKVQKKLATQIRQAVIKDMSKKKVRPEYYSLRDQKRIAEAEITQSFFEVSKFIPVKLEDGMLVNYLILKEFSKRLKGYNVSMRFDEDSIGRKLIIGYSHKTNKGKIELYELPKSIFGSLKKIPTATIEAAVLV